MSLRIQIGLCGLGSLLAVSLAGCGGEGAASAPPALPRVTVAHPTIRKLIDEDPYIGRLEASAEVAVRSRVRGHIQKIHFKDGDLVKKGQLLFELDPRPFQAAIDMGLAKAKVAEAQGVAAQKDFARQSELLVRNAAAKSDVEKAEADMLSYKAQVAATMKDVDRSKLDLEYSRITAPISGRIGRAQLTEGNLVDAGGTDPVLTTIVAVDPIYVYFTIDERALQSYTKEGQRKGAGGSGASLREEKIPFHFGLDTDKGYPHEGLLDFAENKVDRSTGTIEVRGTVDNPKYRFVPGYQVRVRVPVSDEYEAVVVPDTAVLSDQDRKYLLVLGKDNVVVRRDFTPGKLLDDGMRVVLPASGEEKSADKDWNEDWEKQWVIVLGMQRARIDYPVEPMDGKGQSVDTRVTAP